MLHIDFIIGEGEADFLWETIADFLWERKSAMVLIYIYIHCRISYMLY